MAEAEDMQCFIHRLISYLAKVSPLIANTSCTPELEHLLEGVASQKPKLTTLLKHFRTNRINYRYTVSNNSFLKSFKSNYLLQLQGVHDWTKSVGYARELIISLSHASLHVQVTCARQQLCTERVIENACSQTTSDLHDTAGEQ